MFEAVAAAYRLPKAPPNARRPGPRRSRRPLSPPRTRLPLANAEGCGHVLALAAQLAGRSNPNALSDLQCASYLAVAGLRGCLANVAINLPAIKDLAIAADITAQAEALRALLPAESPEKTQ